MKINIVKEQKGTLQKLKNLLEDGNKKVQGVFYTNSFFSKRYLARSHVLVDDVDLDGGEDSIKLTVSARVEPTGLWEVENTLDMLVKHEAGDMPGFIQEGTLALGEEQQLTPDTIMPASELYNVDILLIMKQPDVTYQEFTIAGVKFTLLNLHHKLEDEYEQTVTMLFGPIDQMYFFSNFYDKSLSVRDAKIILDLIMDENITGKVIKGVSIELDNGVNSTVYPYEELFSPYRAADGAYVIGNGYGYIRIPEGELKNYKMTLEPNAMGRYTIKLTSFRGIIRLYME